MNQYNQYNQHMETPGNTKKDSSSAKVAQKTGFQGASYAKLAKSAIFGTIAGIFSSVALMVIFAFIINAAFGDPDSVINLFTGTAASIGAMTGGFYASKVNGSRGFVSGITTGIVISAVILTVMVFNGKHPAENHIDTGITFKLIMILCQVLFACAGGIFAVNSHKSKKAVHTYPIGKKK